MTRLFEGVRDSKRRVRRLAPTAQNGYCQATLATTAVVNQGYISEIERDLVKPRRRTLDALAAALNMPNPDYSYRSSFLRPPCELSYWCDAS